MSAIAVWLATHGLDKYAATLEEHEIGVAELPELTERHLIELGLPLGARIRLLKAVRQNLGPTVTGESAAQAAAHAAAKTPASERRPVTVMFCDIVGSMKLTAALDPEAARGVMLGYWRLVEQAAARHLGHIAQHLGDGALIYFGYPEAREDDAERAILASLSLLSEIAGLDTGSDAPLRLRIGIASGTVVLNEFSASAGAAETLAIGHAVHLASRLQSLAAPGTIVIDGPTKDLASGLFKIVLQAEVAVAGIDEPVAVYRVDGAEQVRSRFEARRVGVSHSLLGRAGELNLLLNRWDTAASGLGQLVLITGEPGIGKSRLLAEVAGRVAVHQALMVQLQCWPHATSTPLHPVVDWLTQSAGLAAGDSRQTIADKINAAFSTGVSDVQTLVDLLDRNPASRSEDPSMRRVKTLAAVAGLFAAMASARPLLLVAEDLHWCDPTTLEFFQQLLARAQALPLLLLATARPEFQHDFGRSISRTDMALPRLDRSHADALARQVLGARQISAPLLDMVAERADGVPLFVEELVRSMKELGAIVHSGSGVSLASAADRAAIPRGLESILMARVDRLGPLKTVAQVAACIGRHFTLALLAQVTGLDQERLRLSLAAIAESGLIAGEGPSPHAAYRFSHALVRDAAYNSMLLSERQPVHQRIAAILAAGDGPSAPEVMAQHLTAAQMVLPAIEKWCEAGEAAKQRSADAEAIEHLSHALRLVEQLPAPQRKERELEVLLALVAPLRALKGFAAQDVAKLTTRALGLADDLKNARSILPLLYNNWVYTFVTSHRQRSEALARDILARSIHDHTNLVRMTGLRAVAATQFTAGEFQPAAQHFEESIALYELAAQADLTQVVGLDGKVTALGYNSLARWCLGDAATAHRQIRQALAYASTLNHISTTAFITYHQALLAGVLERDEAVLLANGKQLEAIGQEHRFEMWLICGKLLQSLGACLVAATQDNIEVAENLFTDFEAMGVVYRPLYGTLLADAWLRQGNREQGMSHIATAKALMEKTGERWCEAEVYRLEGQLVGWPESSESFDKALAVAAAQGARSWQARIQRTRAAAA